MSQERKPLDATAYGAMVLLCALWGFQQAAIKLIAADVSLLMQAAIRSGAATLLVVGWGFYRGIPLFSRDGTLAAGIGAGLLFGAEFALIYGGLGHTNVSRMTVFIYLAPPLTALGLHLFVRGERLAPLQWVGVLVAFAGLALAFSDGFSSSETTWAGDLCGLGHAVGVERHAGQVDPPGERGVQGVEPRRLVLPGGHHADAGARVPQEELDQFPGRVARGAHDRHVGHRRRSFESAKAGVWRGNPESRFRRGGGRMKPPEFK